MKTIAGTLPISANVINLANDYNTNECVIIIQFA